MRYNPITTSAGLFAGIGAALWTLFEYAMGWHGEKLETGAVTGFIAIIFPLAAILWALRSTKASFGGALTLKQALTCGVAVSAINAAIGIAFFYIYYTYINTGFIGAMQARGETVSVTAQLAAVGIGSIVFGLVVSGVAGLFMRTREEGTE